MIRYDLKIPHEMKIRLINAWFNDEEPRYEYEEDSIMLKWAGDLVQHIMYGEEGPYAHPNFKEIFNILKEYCIIEEFKTPVDLYYESKIRIAVAKGELFSDPEVLHAFKSIFNILGNKAKEISEKVQKDEKDGNDKDYTHILATQLHRGIN